MGGGGGRSAPHSVFICLSPVTQSFFLFFTFFMTSIAFKVHINDNWKICPPPFFILKALGAIWWTKWVQKDQNVQVCELSGSGCSKLVKLCGTRLQQVRACPGRCIGTISRIRSGHRRCHRPSKWAKRAQIRPFCGHNHFWWLQTGGTVWNEVATSQGKSGPKWPKIELRNKWGPAKLSELYLSLCVTYRYVFVWYLYISYLW